MRAHGTQGTISLNYEGAGAGAPVLLVMGLGMNGTGWWRTVPVLAAGLRVVTFDNRGVVHGQEDVMGPPANGQLLASLIPMHSCSN